MKWARHPNVGPAVAALVLQAQACSGEPGVETFDTPSIAPEDEGEEVDVAGTWAYKQVLSQYVREAFGDGYEHQLITVFAFGPVTAIDARSYGWTDLICLVEMTDLSGAHLALTDGYYQNPPTPTVYLEIDEATIGSPVFLPQQVELYGVNLEDPLNDPLPTDPTDERIYDFDNDTKAGFTILVDGPAFGDGEIWAIQRYVYGMDGLIVSANEMSGLIDGYTENAYIYTSAGYLPSTSDTYADTEEGHNYFQMIRVADDYSCDRLLAEKDSLFTQ